jgi:hypothetical protein
VEFCNASASSCTGPNLIGTAQVVASTGQATFKFIPGPGTHSYKAVYLGAPNAGYLSSSSLAAPLIVTSTTVGSNTPTVTIASSGSAGNYTLTATVPGTTTQVPTGNVSFLDTSNNNYVLGTAVLTPNFSLKSSLSAYGYPISIAAGDFNGDGIPDLAVVNRSASLLQIFTGKGDGTFTLLTHYVLGSEPDSVVAADFNSDGVLDLAVTNGGGNSVTILMGKGNGTFTTKNGTPTGSNPERVVAGDFNGDGIPDLAVTNSADSTVSILLGNGDGTFNPQNSPSTGPTPYGLAVGDFNGDGIQDLAVCDYGSVSAPIPPGSNTVTILQGNGDGTFNALAATPGTGPQPYGIAVGDFNGDGISDLAVANEGGSTLTILQGVGDGTFTALASPATGLSPVYVAVSDFNGDGIEDLAVAADQAGVVDILQGNGDGTFTLVATPATASSAYPTGVGSRPVYVAVADLNGDGVPDLVSADSGISFASILLGSHSRVATLTGVSPVGTGTHYVDAMYPGDSNFSSNTSSTIPLTAEPVPTTLSLMATTSGAQVALTATLSPYNAQQNHATDGETITFLSNGSSIGTGTLSSGSATATVNLSALAPGQDSLTASYATDGNFASATSNTVPYSVVPGPTIAFSIPEKHAADAPFQVTATSNSEGAITYSLVSGPANVSASGLVTLGGTAGTVVVQATQAASGSYGAGSATASFLVASGSVWAVNAAGSASVFDLSGNPFSPAAFTGGGLGTVSGTGAIAFDSYGNAWLASSNGVSEFNFDGAPVSSTAYTGSATSSPVALAIDGAGLVWLANADSTISVLSNSGTAVPNQGSPATASGTPSGLSIDISGNVWVANATANTVTEILGAAAPSSPASTALANGTTGAKP